MSEKLAYHLSQLRINFNWKKSTNKTEVYLFNYLNICLHFQRRNNNFEIYTFLLISPEFHAYNLFKKRKQEIKIKDSLLHCYIFLIL